MNEPIPQDVREIARQIDLLGETLRCEPDAGFERRVLDVAKPSSAVVARIGVRSRWRSPMALAAGLSLAASVAIVFVASRVEPSVAPADTELAALASEVDAWLDMTELFDDGFSERASTLSEESGLDGIDWLTDLSVDEEAI